MGGGDRLRKAGRKLAVACAAVAIFVLLAELGARLAESGPMSLYDSSPYAEDPTGVLPHVHRPDFRGRWDSTWYETNSRGWRGPEAPQAKPEGEFRIVALGDSCTFGKGVLEAETWPRVLEAELSRDLPEGRSVRVVNLGVNGYATRDYVRVFETVGAALQPDLVILGYNINDFPNPVRSADNQVFHAAGDRGTLRARLRRWMGPTLRDELNRLAIYRFARATYYDMSRQRDYAQMEAIAQDKSSTEVEGLDQGFERETAVMRRLVDGAAALDARVVIFLFPYESMVYLEDSNRGPEERVLELTAELNVPYVDVASAFRREAHATQPPRQLFVRGDRYHPNPAGYRLTAETLAGSLRELAWVPGN
ncbi:MAG TPA: SGNH/GDSL hydrolase family protein [Planctomycetota bacterium]|nr:SGNH/GDSL hydrolase family protein [Planctomycetota bacterium]